MGLQSRAVQEVFVRVGIDDCTGVDVERKTLVIKDAGPHPELEPFVGFPITHVNGKEVKPSDEIPPPALEEVVLPKVKDAVPIFHPYGEDHIDAVFEAAGPGKIRYHIGGHRRPPLTKLFWETEGAEGDEAGRLIVPDMGTSPAASRTDLVEFLAAILALCRKQGVETNITDVVKIRESYKTFDAVQIVEGAAEGQKGLTLRFVSPLPCTVLSGFLGSGKTTLMNRLLSNREGLKCAVIVNDMAEVQIDAGMITGLKETEEKMVELSNGCICCTLRDDLIGGVAELAADPRNFDYLIVESTGISEPMPVAHTFELGTTKSGLPLSAVARLDSLVTVVDTKTFATNLRDRATLQELRMTDDKEDKRDIGSLFADQVEVANVVLLNKTDEATKEHIATAKDLLHVLNPTAKAYETQHCNVPLEHALGTGLYTPGSHNTHTQWIAESEKIPHKPESEEFGVINFSYTRAGPDARPFHPDRFRHIIDQTRAIGDEQRVEGPLNTCLYRCKGWCWIGGTASVRYSVHITAHGPQVQDCGKEWAAMDLYGDERYAQLKLMAAWDVKNDVITKQLLEARTELRDSEKLRTGDTAELKGLKGRADLNGELCNILGRDKKSGRFMIRLQKEGEEEMKIKPENLEHKLDGSSHPMVAAAQETVRKLKAAGQWHPVNGDRRQELVFIGDKEKMDPAAITALLDAALCTDEEAEALRAQTGQDMPPGQAPAQTQPTAPTLCS